MPHGEVVHDGLVAYRKAPLRGVRFALAHHREPISGTEGPALGCEARHANLGALKVEEGGEGASALSGQRAKASQALGVLFVSTVRKVQAGHVHTRGQKALEGLVVIAGRSQGADHPRAPVTGHNVQDSCFSVRVLAYALATAGDDLNMFDRDLLSILVCPVSKAPLKLINDEQELACVASALAYPIRDGIPVLLADEARTMGAEELDTLRGEG